MPNQALTFVALVALVAVACGAPQEPEPASRPRPATVEAPPAETEGRAEVTREALGAILGQSPGHFFGLVEVEGVGDDEGTRFAGWRIVSLPSDTPAWLDVRVGDVVTAVNGMAVERPDDAQRVYEALRVASEVRIDLTRAGEARVVRVPIVDAYDESPPEEEAAPAPAGAPPEAPSAPPPTS